MRKKRPEKEATHEHTHNLPAFQRMQYDFAQWIRKPDPEKTPQNIERRRMNIYRELFYNNVAGFLENAFPVARETLGQEVWTPLVEKFFAEHLAQSPYFREIPLEFMTWLQQNPKTTEKLPPWVMELLHYEWLELEISTRDGEWPDDFGVKAPDPESPVKLSPFYEMEAYQFPVHEISANNQLEEPPATPTLLTVYRRRDHKLRFMALSPQVALFLQALSENPESTPLDALKTVEQQIEQPLYETWLTQTLKDLAERDIVSSQ